MWTIEVPWTCAQCQEPFQVAGEFDMCVICGRPFCGRHLMVRDGVPNCAACEQVRRHQEQHGAISQADADRVARLLTQDVTETIGAGHEAAVRESVARIRLFSHDPGDFEQRVVNDVQQWLHDTFVDTSWPACPDHPQHPLWYADSAWSCERSGRRWLLGTLSRTKRDTR